MDKPFVGSEKEYSKNYDAIFRKPLRKRIKETIDNWLFKIFVEEK